MAYFKHKTLIVEAYQFFPLTYENEPIKFLDTWEKTVSGPTVGTILCKGNKIFVYPTDWVVYGNKGERFVIKDDAFNEFFQFLKSSSEGKKQ